jgi:valyl-tRNA synthetase
MLTGQRETIAFLAGVDPDRFEIIETVVEKPQNATAVTVLGIEIYLSLEGAVDSGAEKLRLQKELQEAESQIQRLESLLNGAFAQRAPANVVERERQKLATYKETAASLQEQLEAY